MRITLIFLLLLFGAGEITAFSQADLDRATLEVDRDYSKEAEKEIYTEPKRPVIKIEGEGENLDGYPGGEGGEEIVPVGRPGGEDAVIKEK